MICHLWRRSQFPGTLRRNADTFPPLTWVYPAILLQRKKTVRSSRAVLGIARLAIDITRRFPPPRARRANNTGWVCENDGDRPSDCGDSKRACTCGGAGTPCLVCNVPEPGERLRLPAGFVPREDADKGSVHRGPKTAGVQRNAKMVGFHVAWFVETVMRRFTILAAAAMICAGACDTLAQTSIPTVTPPLRVLRLRSLRRPPIA